MKDAGISLYLLMVYKIKRENFGSFIWVSVFVIGFIQSFIIATLQQTLSGKSLSGKFITPEFEENKVELF